MYLTVSKPEDQAPNSNKIHWWQGASGAWHIHTVYPFTRDLPFEEANYILVWRNPFTGVCKPLYIGQSGDFWRRLSAHEKFKAAQWMGANEIHVHFLARSHQQRFAVETDLRQGHATPLNEQPTQARSKLFSV